MRWGGLSCALVVIIVWLLEGGDWVEERGSVAWRSAGEGSVQCHEARIFLAA